MDAKLGSGPLPAPALPAIDPAAAARLQQARTQARAAGRTADTETADTTDRHPAGILDFPGDVASGMKKGAKKDKPK